MTSAYKLEDGEATSHHPLPTPHVSTSPRHKRCSEDGEKMADPCSAHSRPKRPRRRSRRRTPEDPVTELAVRLKRQLMLEVVSSANSREDPIDPLGDPVRVRIRSKDNNLFLLIDPGQRKPVMGFITEEDEDAVFILQYFSSEEYGEICTLFHKASCGYLAVDERTDQPTVRCQTGHPPVCRSPDSDLSIRQPLGARPVAGEDDIDSSPPPSDPPDPDPCCYFQSVPVGEEACLSPKVCRNKCLSYNQKTLEVLTVLTQRRDFIVRDEDDDKTTLSRP